MEEDKHAFSDELAVPVNQPERRRQAKSVARRTRAVLLLDHLDTLRLVRMDAEGWLALGVRRFAG